MSGPLPPTANKLSDDFVASGSLQLADATDDDLLARLRALLDDGIYGMCFSAYLEGQGPALKSVLPEAQVRQRLQAIVPHTRWIRTFSCTEGNQHAASVAHEHGVKTLVGAWIDDDLERNEEELTAVIEVARAGHADRIAVGNEVLLRGELSEQQIIDYLQRVKDAVPGVPVAYVDAYFQFPQHPALTAACDFLPINCYPFWEGCPLEHSVAYAQEMVRRVAAVADGKPVVIAETGWPTAGTPEQGAVPGLRHMALYALNLIRWAEQADIPLFWFSAFDEAWKVGAEGDCGAFWGFWDAEGTLKLS
ncbi:MAG: hypothetical protein KTR31_33005 [Myxococcales bacterium]|nr:hypothetical protein [Myxococcales bacterium]